MIYSVRLITEAFYKVAPLQRDPTRTHILDAFDGNEVWLIWRKRGDEAWFYARCYNQPFAFKWMSITKDEQLANAVREVV
jgi:hypothetical protein